MEREVTSERIQDKIAASKRKGIWVGGPVPLGYDLKDGTPVVLKEEAERVRLIFRRYLEVSGINELVRDLRAKNICTKARTFSTGETRGGIPFGRGAFSYFLRNRFFIGEVKYKSTRARSCLENSLRSWTRPCSRLSSKNYRSISPIRP